MSIKTEFLHQDEYWLTEDGRRLHLDTMSQRHLDSVLGMLRRNALVLKFHDDLSTCFIPMPGEWTQAFDDIQDCISRQFDMSSKEFLESTRLVRRLRVLTGEESPNAHVPLSF
jgi:hypothetical protein